MAKYQRVKNTDLFHSFLSHSSPFSEKSEKFGFIASIGRSLQCAAGTISPVYFRSSPHQQPLPRLNEPPAIKILSLLCRDNHCHRVLIDRVKVVTLLIDDWNPETTTAVVEMNNKVETLWQPHGQHSVQLLDPDRRPDIKLTFGPRYNILKAPKWNHFPPY